jgi:hypothetical protein
MVYLQISLNVAEKDRAAAAAIYTQFKGPFLAQVTGALAKDLLIRDEDVQVMHAFDSVENAKAYLSSEIFTKDVVVGLKPLLKTDPEVRIYSVV